MRKIKIYILLIVTLLIGSFFTGVLNIKSAEGITATLSNTLEENDADLPTWNVGDKWTYRLDVSLEQKTYFDLDFQISIENLIFEVVNNPESDDMYKLEMTVPYGDLSGSGSADFGFFTFTGNIFNGEFDGFAYVKKSNLGLHNCQGTIEADTNKILVPHIKAGFQIEFEQVVNDQIVKANFSNIVFPMNVDDSWAVPLTYVNISLNAIQPNLGQSRLYTYIPGHGNICDEWDLVDVGTTNYDSLKISGTNYGDKSDIWYSPAVGNIIKMDYKNIEMGYGYNLNTLSMSLKSTTYQPDSDPPATPSTPIGPVEFNAGEIGEYETSTTDPDGNKIRYIFDWGDGTSDTYTDFTESGITVTESHQWRKKGEHNLKVKARDKFGMESSWSDPLVINVYNEAPETPRKPDGPTSGSKQTSYTYNTLSNDSDGHRIKYGWDWNGDLRVDQWTDLKNSGEEVFTSHQWNSQDTYDIRVKAEDEYGEESDWSDPLSVSIPKNKAYGSFVLRLIYIIKERFSLIFNLFDKIII